MSTDQLSSQRFPRNPARGDAKLVAYDQYIDAQVESTRRMVKIVEIATALVVLAAGVLAFLLVAAVVEHWLVPGGFPTFVRALLFAMLAGGVAYFVYRRLWPLVMRSINPVYAAQAIEQTGPSLKNSLINLLLFRERRSEVSDAVYETLEEYAAQRLSRVPIDSAVDRSLLIRFGYMLLAVVALALLYKVFSPKDPWIAAQRVLMPWAEIVPASRVTISGIEPGSITVSQGEFIDVSANVRGIGDDDAVLLRFTTEDAQAVNKPIPMKLSPDGRFAARLPQANGPSSSVGLAQNVRYRIEAGDARSLDYRVRVVTAPSIIVERVDYEYPAYTGDTPRTVKGLGDVRAIEGTRITIHARANGPIDQAHVDFDANGRRNVRMAADGTMARATFELRLREDRVTPRHASYVLRFTNRDGRENRNPVKYAIQVDPDVAPEARIVAPEEKELQVRLDETVAIEVDAIDPDYGLADVRLHGEVSGREVFNQPLLTGKHTGRFTARYQFTPSVHDLRAGDVMEYWVGASDVRTPQPNTTSSERKTLRIISPDPAQPPPPDQLAQRDPQQQQSEQQPGGEQQQNGPQREGPGQAGQQQDATAGEQDQTGGQQQAQDGRSGRGEQFSRDAAQESEKEQAGEGEARGEREPRESESPDNGELQPGEPLSRDAQRSEEGSSSNDKQTGAGAAGGEASQDAAQPDGARPEGAPSNGATNGQRRDGNEPGDSISDSSPVSTEGDNDGEAFDRIRRHLQREGALPERDRDTDEQLDPDAAQERERGRAEEREPGQADNTEPFNRDSGQSTDGVTEQLTNDQAQQQDQFAQPDEDKPSIKGESGAGSEQDSQGAPEASNQMKPDEKRQEAPSQGEQTDSAEPPAGGRGKKESDSQGEQGGDRAGGGEEGGGQDSPRDGTGSAGQNQSADEGAGESAERGAGTDSSDAGQDALADDRTGQSSEETPGRGSDQRDGEGVQPGDTEEPVSRDAQQSAEEGQGDQERGRPEEGESRPQEQSDAAARDGRESANQTGAPTGAGGETGSEAAVPQRSESAPPNGDEANLEYARKQTDLVLERLADQLNRKQVDNELLDELGWSEDDLRRFVERWQTRKESAARQDSSGAAKRELDEALRSLGLRRGPMQQGPVKEDSLRDLREGYRGTVPLEYRDRLRAYNQGVSRARPDAE